LPERAPVTQLIGWSKIMKTLLLALILLTCCAAAASPAGDDAEQAFQNKDYATAVRLYQQITAQKPDEAFAWYKLGVSLRHVHQLQESLEALQKASSFHVVPLLIKVQTAATLTKMGKKDEALVLLNEVAKAGMPAGVVESEEAFAPLKADARYTAAIEEMREQSEPCKGPQKFPEYRQLDFWVGEWNVIGMGGQQVGSSHVDLILGDCVVFENWSGGFGSQGKSFNKYNPQAKRWEQYWVDDQGATTFFQGKLEGKDMVYYADGQTPDGRPMKRRLTFFNLGPDKVRQFSQQSADGKTWTTEYDLTYVRRTKNAL
jgi:tetratricopeptide (TPR) repeat protein